MFAVSSRNLVSSSSVGEPLQDENLIERRCVRVDADHGRCGMVDVLKREGHCRWCADHLGTGAVAPVAGIRADEIGAGCGRVGAEPILRRVFADWREVA